METKDTLSSCSDSDEQEMQRMQKQANILKENSMNKFNALKTTTQRLKRQNFTNCPLFQRAFSSLFSDDVRTFKEETLTLEQYSRSKLHKETVKPYDYTKQNSHYEIVKPPTREYLDQLWVTELAAVQEQDTQDIYGVMEDAQCRQTEIFQRVEALVDNRLSSAVHFELQGYMTHTWVQDQRIYAQDTLIATLTTHLSSLQGHLVMALGEIQALQAREQARAGATEGAGSST
nr:hypothetical protein [Tanacetum cinerariifolium]